MQTARWSTPCLSRLVARWARIWSLRSNLNTDIIGKSRSTAANVRTAFGFVPLTLTQGITNISNAALPTGLTRGIFQQERDRPSLFGVMSTSLGIMQDRLTRSRLAGDLPDVHITPRVGHIGLLEFDRAKEAGKVRMQSNAKGSNWPTHCRP